MIKARLDAILLATLALKKRENGGFYNNGKSLAWNHEVSIEFPWTHKEKPYFVRGKADYTLSRGNANWTETNLVVVKAAARGINAEYEALSNLGKL